MHAEIAYLFRHALLRDAAYDLQLPANRAALHVSTLAILEDLYGGLPPDPTAGGDAGLKYEPLPIDEFAAEMADHAEWAARASNPAPPELTQRLRIYLKRAAMRAGLSFQNRQSARLWLRAAELLTGEDRARALYHAAGMESAAGHTGESEVLVRKALEVLDQPGYSGPLLPRCLVLLGHACTEAERLQEAEQAYLRGLELCERQGDTRQATAIKIRLAYVYSRTRRLDDSTDFYSRALEDSRAQQDPVTEALCVAGLAGVAAAGGRNAEADKLYAKALAMNRQRGDRRAEAVTLGNMASYLWMSRQWDRAETAMRQVLPLHREIGNRRFEGRALGGLAAAALQREQPHEAMSIALQALAIDREVGNRTEEGLHMCTVGRCLLALGRLEEAKTSWRAGVALLRELKVDDKVEYSRGLMREACTRHGVPPFE